MITIPKTDAQRRIHMKKLLVVKSSVRNGRAADNVIEILNIELEKYDFDVSIADFRQMPLPFFDSELIPSHEGFAPTNENVQKWTKMVDEADAVLILAAEYNHSYTPVIKNAIDWVYREWKDKPVLFVGYGWAGGARAIKHLRDVFASNIAAKTIETEANLHFTKEINLDGSPIGDQAGEEIDKVLKQI